jgi:hypothetical protein
MAISIIYTINNSVYYYTGFTDQFNKDLNYYRIDVSGNRPSHPFIFLINKDIEKDKDDDDYDNK